MEHLVSVLGFLQGSFSPDFGLNTDRKRKDLHAEKKAVGFWPRMRQLYFTYDYFLAGIVVLLALILSAAGIYTALEGWLYSDAVFMATYTVTTSA
jgi:hypothetical protein